MDIETILNALAKPATKFQTGGFRPSNSVDESWIGRVFLYAEEEEIPLDSHGKPMQQLAQVFLPKLPFIPPALQGIELLTVFMSVEFPEAFEEMGNNWLIREYRSIGELVRRDLTSEGSFIRAFPLKPDFVERDFPLWDSEDIPQEIATELLRLEDAGVISGYYDVIEHTYDHKIGGYPSFCQSGVNFGDGFEFVLQISSDEKAQLNVIDSGSFMFARNSASGDWSLYFDFY